MSLSFNNFPLLRLILLKPKQILGDLMQTFDYQTAYPDHTFFSAYKIPNLLYRQTCGPYHMIVGSVSYFSKAYERLQILTK